MLHRLELFVHDVLLSIAGCKNVAFHIFRARFLSVDFKEHIVFGVHKPDAAAVHCGVHHGAKVDGQPKLVICVKPCVVHSVCNVFELEKQGDLPPHGRDQPVSAEQRFGERSAKDWQKSRARMCSKRQKGGQRSASMMAAFFVGSASLT